MKVCISVVLWGALLISSASAQDLVYEPVNPSFGGNPFNSAHLLAIANAQNDFDPPSSGTAGLSDIDRFIRSLQGRLLSSLASEVVNAIFGEDAQESGRIVFGDQTIEFVRTLEGIQLTIIEADGSQTVVTVPTLITEGLNAPALSPQSLTAPPPLSTGRLTETPLPAGTIN